MAASRAQVRVVPGVDSFADHAPTLSYAIRDWVWRRTQPPEGGAAATAPPPPPAGLLPPAGYLCGKCGAAAAHYLSDCPLSAAAAVPPLGLQPGRQPSGFNIFVESLTTAVDEIHRDVRTNLPSMDVGGEDEDEDSDGEAEEPILTARGARRHSWENR